MARIIEYPKAKQFDKGDVLIKDGPNGTMQISAAAAFSNGKYEISEWKNGRIAQDGSIVTTAKHGIYCVLNDGFSDDYIYVYNRGNLQASSTNASFRNSAGTVLLRASGLGSRPVAVPEGTSTIVISFELATGSTIDPSYGQYIDVHGGGSSVLISKLQMNDGTFTIAPASRTDIPNGTDYNTLTAIGNYKVPSSGSAGSMINCPVTVRHSLTVFGTNATATIYQVLFDHEGKIYYRFRLNTTSEFTDWVKFLVSSPSEFSVDLNWVLKGHYTAYGGIDYSLNEEYSISEPIKLYAGDKVTFTAKFINGYPGVIKYFDRWNTFWASLFGKNAVIFTPSIPDQEDTREESITPKTFSVVIPATGYYIFSSYSTDASVTVARTAESVMTIQMDEKISEWNYGQEKHNYVDEFDYVPDMTSRRTNSILAYSADDKKTGNYIVNSVAYLNGDILAVRAGGDIVLIQNDENKTERVLANVPNAQDWRGVFMDSNLNVYVSPHNTMITPALQTANRGLYKIEYGTFNVTKVISLYRGSEIKVWVQNEGTNSSGNPLTTTYNLGDVIFLDSSQNSNANKSLRFYECSAGHVHKSGEAFDSTKWAVINAPVWSSGSSYKAKDIVLYNSLYFWCKSDHTVAEGDAFDYDLWDPATEHMASDDTVWTMCEDEVGNLYAGVYSHSTRENASIYRLKKGETKWKYQHNFVWNGTLSRSIYGNNGVRHVHCINFNPYNNTLYAAVGEVNTIVKSTDHGETWVDMHTPCYYGQPTYVLGVRDGLVIGSDGHYSCGISKLSINEKTMKKCGRTVPGFIFNIRRSDLTGWLYAWTRIDNIAQNLKRCPPLEAIDDPAALEAWKTSDLTDEDKQENLQYWTMYNEWASKYYPEDAIRPQHCVIMVSRDEGDTWETIYKKKCSMSYASFTGFTTVGYFRDGECLAGLEMPALWKEGDNEADRLPNGYHRKNMEFVQPIVISEGKKHRTPDGFDLEGEIYIKTNNSDIVAYD